MSDFSVAISSKQEEILIIPSCTILVRNEVIREIPFPPLVNVVSSTLRKTDANSHDSPHQRGSDEPTRVG